MLKILYFTSETKKKFGIYKVVNILKKRLGDKLKVKLSQNIFDIFFFKPQLIHIHGCWHPKLFIVFLLAKITFTKIIISPHGMLDPFSFAQKKMKKIFAWFLYQKYIFYFSDLIIVNSNFEKKNLIKKIKFSKKIRIIKHGVDIPKKNNKIKKKKKLKFVFFSRIHPSKNLMRLVEIWKNNYFFKDYYLDIFGEVEDIKYFTKLKTNIKNHKNVNYRGIIKNYLSKKLSKYDIFLHPSQSENFGLVILEAMSCGLFPVINKKLEWKILDKKKLGYSINFTEKNLIKLIIKLERIKRKIRNKKFKMKLRNFLLNNYNWNLIINEYYKCYSKLYN